LGVLFRYVDENNYYRLSLDAERRYRRLVKKVDGVFHVLWEDSGTYPISQSFTVTVDAEGSTLTGYLDNELLFRMNDDSHKFGRIGLYCWANVGARFERAE